MRFYNVCYFSALIVLLKCSVYKRGLSKEQKQAMINNADFINREWLEELQGGLPAISLPSATALNTAFCNDVNPELLYAQQLMGLAKKEDIVV